MESPNYYGILPANVRYDKRLKPMEKIMYCEITALTNKNGYCYASNSYFAELYEVHKNTVGVWINHLVECGYLRAELIYKAGSKEVQERRLYISIPVSVSAAENTDSSDKKNSASVSEDIDSSTEKDSTPANENIDTPQQKDCDPINKNIEENNTSINITSINITSILLKDTHTGEQKEKVVREIEVKKEQIENAPVEIQQILKKYKELELPEYDYRPDNYIILGVYRGLGAVKLFEALTLMSKSEFVKSNMSINAIFKIENLKKALNGNFKDKVNRAKNTCEKKKKFQRPTYENTTGDFIKDILNGTIGGD